MLTRSGLVRPLKHFLLVTAVVALWAGGLIRPAAAQNENPPAKTDAQLASEQRRQYGRPTSASLRAGKFEDRDKFNQYYAMMFQRMRLEENLSKLPAMRVLLGRERATAGNAPEKEVHTALNQILLAGFQELLNDDQLSIVLRYNAILEIAALNEKELPPGGRGVAVPLPATLPLLRKVFEDESAPDALRLGALLGLERHVSLGEPSVADLDAIQAAMFKTFSQRETPTTRDTPVHLWIRRRAADVLGAIGKPGTTAGGTEVLEALLTDVENEEAPVKFRCQLAFNLGQLDYSGAPSLNYSRIAHAVANLGGLAAKESTKLRELAFYFHCLRSALQGPDPKTPSPQGIAAVAAAPHKEAIAGLLTRIADVEKALNDRTKEEDEILPMVTDGGSKLESWVQENPLANNQLKAG